MEVLIMTKEEIDKLTDKIYARFKNTPGVDKVFVRKCLTGIANLKDKDVEDRIRMFAKFL